MHRLFIDQSVRIEIAHALRQQRYEVYHACEAGLQRHLDEAVFRWAVQKGLTVATFDADFAARAHWGRGQHYGVLRLHVEPQTPAQVLPPLERYLSTHSREALKNTLVDLSERWVRVQNK